MASKDIDRYSKIDKQYVSVRPYVPKVAVDTLETGLAGQAAGWLYGNFLPAK